jgi:predicted nucleotidyltransferase
MAPVAASDELMPRLRDAARRLLALGATEVYVFGSAATGKAGPDSDVDLAVRGIPPARVLDALGAAWDAVGQPVDLVTLEADTPFTRYLVAKGGLLRVG